MSKSKSKQKSDILDKIESMQTTKKVVDISSINISGIKLPPGRPVDPNSPRQMKLKEQDEKREAGLLKRGRPADPNSPNYAKRIEAEERKSQPGYVAKRGRPTDPNSPRQKGQAEKDERKRARLEQLVSEGKIILVEDEDGTVHIEQPVNELITVDESEVTE